MKIKENIIKVINCLFTTISILCAFLYVSILGFTGTKFSYYITETIKPNYFILFSVLSTIVALFLKSIFLSKKENIFSIINILLLSSFQYVLEPLVEQSYKKYILYSPFDEAYSFILTFVRFALFAYLIHINIKTIKENLKFDFTFIFSSIFSLLFMSIMIYVFNRVNSIVALFNYCYYFSFLFFGFYSVSIKKEGLISSYIYLFLIFTLTPVYYDKFILEEIEQYRFLLLGISFTVLLVTYVGYMLNRFDKLKLEVKLKKNENEIVSNIKKIMAVAVLGVTIIALIIARLNIEFYQSAINEMFIILSISSLIILVLTFRNSKINYLFLYGIITLLITSIISILCKNPIFIADGIYCMIFACLVFNIIYLFEKFKFVNYSWVVLMFISFLQITSIFIFTDRYICELIFNYLLAISLVVIIFNYIVEGKKIQSLSIFILLFLIHFGFQYFSLCINNESHLYYHLLNRSININSVYFIKSIVILSFSIVWIIELRQYIKIKRNKVSI